MSTLHPLRITLWNNATGELLLGYSNYVWIVKVGDPLTAGLQLLEDGNNPGTYIRNGVAGGYYDIYLDLDKSGVEPVANPKTAPGLCLICSSTILPAVWLIFS